MTTRNDINVDYQTSPRIAEVKSPSVELTMQDTVDTLRKEEDKFSGGLAFTKLINASGKENLGGGVFVGITVALQNAKVAFEGRTTPAESGTVTTGSSTPVNGYITFVDTSADFIAAGIERGSLVINYTDQSIADVFEVVNSTTLRTKVLVNGVTNTYSVSDVYDVFNIVQCDISGGNLVAVDENGDIISPVLPTAFTQIVRTSSASATISEQADIQYASFGGGVTIDTTNGASGTAFPAGTPRQPVNNFTDALTIATTRGFSTFYIIGDATIDTGLNYTGFTFVGESKNKSTFTISAAANVTNSEFTDATVEGTLDGGNVLFGCSLLTINFVDGFIEQCVLNETITLSGAADAHFLDCFSGIPGLSTPTIDMGGSGSSLALRNYNGGITLINKSGSGDDVSVDMNSGQITIDNTVTAGTLVLRGVGIWSNRSSYTGGATVIDQLVKTEDVQQSSFNDGVTIDVTNGSSGTNYPLGTSGNPVDNLSDAVTIASSRGLTKLFIRGNLTIGTETTWTGWDFIGRNPLDTILTFSGAASTNSIGIENSTISGTIGGSNIIATDCILSDNLNVHSGLFRTCGFGGDIFLTGDNTVAARFHDCYGAAEPGGDQPSIDAGGDGPTITLAGYSGAMTILNKTGASSSAGLSIWGGLLTLDSTVTAGVVIAAGHGRFVDNSVGATVLDYMTKDTAGAIQELKNTTIDGNTFEAIQEIVLAMANGRIVESPTGTFAVYKQDNTTVNYTLVHTATERTRS